MHEQTISYGLLNNRKVIVLSIRCQGIVIPMKMNIQTFVVWDSVFSYKVKDIIYLRIYKNNMTTPLRFNYKNDQYSKEHSNAVIFILRMVKY